MNVDDILNSLGEFSFDCEVSVKLKSDDHYIENLALVDIIPADAMMDKCILILEEVDRELVGDKEEESRSCKGCLTTEAELAQKLAPTGSISLIMVQDEHGQWWCRECFQERTVKQLYTTIREHLPADQRLNIAREIYRAICRKEPPVWADDSTLIDCERDISESDLIS